MKIILLAESRNPHTIKWAKGLASKGHIIVIFSLFESDEYLYNDYSNIEISSANLDSNLYKTKEGSLSKIKFLFALPKLKKVLNKFKPDILHSHYISSYGILGYLSGFHPYIVSVWGNDIFEVPKKSKILEFMIKRTLAKSDRILSTSNVMAKEIGKYTNKNIEITPFGIELNRFNKNDIEKDKSEIVIGTIKTLEDKYGIKYLIRAFKNLKEKHPDLPLKLLIVGEGSRKEELIEMARILGLQNCTEFTGKVKYDKIHQFHNKLDIAVYPSILDGESFGVSVIESSACEVPVIVSKVGGLPEVVENNVTGLVVKPKDSNALAAAIEKLVLNDKLINSMGINGRKRVEKLYDFKDNLNHMIDIYSDTIEL